MLCKTLLVHLTLMPSQAKVCIMSLTEFLVNWRPIITWLSRGYTLFIITLINY